MFGGGAVLIHAMQIETFDPSAITEFIVKYNGDLFQIKNSIEAEVEILSENYAIVTTKFENLSKLMEFRQVEYVEEPKKLGFMIAAASQASCITQVQKPPYNLTGKGVIVAIIDSGIDYTHPDFTNDDGSSRILYIWDQTAEGTPPLGFTHGTEILKRQLDESLASGATQETLITRDEIGHGTAVAGIAAGNGRASNGVNIGVAPQASIICVKMGESGENNFARTTEIMRGIKYVMDKAEELNMPIAINLSFGTNNGAHDGYSLFEQYISDMSQRWKTSIVVATGNEGGAAHHFHDILEQGEQVDCEFVTADNLQSFFLDVWKTFADNFSFEIISPSGQSTGKIFYTSMARRFLLDEVEIVFVYGQPTNYTVDQEIYIQFYASGTYIREGKWVLRIFGDRVVRGNIDIWLPITEFVSKETRFLTPTETTTLTLPSCTLNVISVGSYNSRVGNISSFSGKGFTRNNVFMKPDLVAPGENILCPKAYGGYDVQTGTSISAPFVTGSAAIMMEWGIIQANDAFLYGQKIKAYLQYGALRDENMDYPNFNWGFGKLCLKNTIDSLNRYRLQNEMGGMRMANDAKANFILYVNTNDIEKLQSLNYVEICKIMFDTYAVVSVDIPRVSDFFNEIGEQSAIETSSILGLMDSGALNASGVTAVQNNPYLELSGQGVLLGFVDTGIDYTKEAFKYEDGTTRIISIWDQSTVETNIEGYCFGTEYSSEQINAALLDESPLTVLPLRDEEGHGTFLASVSASRESGEYLGVCPDAELVIVKLRKASDYYRDLLKIDDEYQNAYESSDLMQGVYYLINKAKDLKRPIAICIGLGTNYGSHDGTSLFETFLQRSGAYPGVFISVAAGNESSARHHTQITLDSQGTMATINLQVAEGENNLWVNIINDRTDRISVGIVSPTGETIDRMPARPQAMYRNKLILEDTVVIVNYLYPLVFNGSQSTVIRLEKATPGIWKINVFGDIVLSGIVHAWLPITNFVKPDTFFLESSPEFTITVPATSTGVATVGSYSYLDGRIAPSSSRGPNRLLASLPDFVAPGVNINGIFPGGYGTMSGTSVAAAMAQGAGGLFLQWGIIEGNETNINTTSIVSYITRGCDRRPDITYPNQEWGYGTLNVQNAIEKMRDVPTNL